MRHRIVRADARRFCPLLAVPQPKSATYRAQPPAPSRGVWRMAIPGGFPRGDPGVEANLLSLAQRPATIARRILHGPDDGIQAMRFLRPSKFLSSLRAPASPTAKMHQPGIRFAIVRRRLHRRARWRRKSSRGPYRRDRRDSGSVRALNAEEALLGKSPNANAIAEASARAAQNPRADDASRHSRFGPLTGVKGQGYAQRSIEKAVRTGRRK